MFPLPWNKAYRKKDGSLTTVDDAIQSGGGQYELPTASANTKGGVKVGSGLTMEGETLNADAQLPEYSSAENGKVLGVDADGELEWATPGGGGVAKIYYKDFSLDSVRWSNAFKITGTASDSSTYDIQLFYITSSLGLPDLSISGYTPINAELIDVYTGYSYMGGFTLSGNPKQIHFGYILSQRTSLAGALAIRVYYVADGDAEQLT